MPLLFEGSQQAQFLKPSVITLVYGLGFGMFFVLLVVPSLLAMQHDVTRLKAAARRALRHPRKSGRAGMAGGVAAVAMAVWFLPTLGAALFGMTLPGLDAVPLTGSLWGAFALYTAGSALIALVAWLVFPVIGARRAA